MFSDAIIIYNSEPYPNDFFCEIISRTFNQSWIDRARWPKSTQIDRCSQMLSVGFSQLGSIMVYPPRTLIDDGTKTCSPGEH